MNPLRAFQDSILAQRVASRFAADANGKMVGKDPKSVVDYLKANILKSGQKVRVWTGRGKQDYHEGTIQNVDIWPKLDDKAFPRDNFAHEDTYVIKSSREPAYEGEPSESKLTYKGKQGPNGPANVSFGKGNERVYKLSLL